MPIRLLVTFAVAALVSAPAVADACSCILSCGSILRAELLFEATVVDISAPPAGSDVQVVRLADVRPVLGEATPTQLLVSVGDTCAYRFKTGTRYLVDAREFGPGRFSATSCGNTRPLADAKGVLAFLHAATPEERPRVWGRVARPFANEFLRRPTPASPVGGAVVTLSGPVTRSIETTANGDFAFPFRDVPDGDYDVRVELPPSRRDIAPPPTSRVHLEPTECTDLRIEPPSTSRIVGRVVGADGSPMSGVRVELFPLPYDHWAGGIMTAGDSDADGRFAIDALAPGLYAGGIAVPFPDEDAPFRPARLLTPRGSADIEVAPGATVELPPIVAAAAPRIVVSGRVLRAPDVGVADGFIVVSALDGMPQATTGGARTDGEGRFTIGLHRGVRYRVMVEIRGRVVASTEVVAGTAPIEIMLPLR